MEEYEIRIARPDEIDLVAAFISEHWKPDHIFAQSRELLAWQHIEPVGQKFDFIVGLEKKSGKCAALLGFIPTSRFDSELVDDRDYWLAIWKVRSDIKAPGLGWALLAHILEQFRPSSVSAVGVSKSGISIYQALGYKVGTLDHYYRLNQTKSSFTLVRNHETVAPTAAVGSTCTFRTVVSVSNLSDAIFYADREFRPRKTREYFRERYQEHPVYKYHFIEIADSLGPVAGIVFRIDEHRGKRAIRIVDFLPCGKRYDYLGNVFDAVMNDCDAEYADLYCFGLDQQGLISSGFRPVGLEDALVIPNYFEPFEQRNVELRFAYNVSDDKSFRIFKGDADQDRPNLLKP